MELKNRLPHEAPVSQCCTISQDKNRLSLSTKNQNKMKFYHKITIEPVMFLFQIASQIVFITSQDLMIKKSCQVNHGYPKEICDDLTNYEKEEASVQTLVSDYLMWRSILEASIKIVSIPLLAWWGDTRGRRGPLIVCLICLGLESAVFLLNTLVSSWPIEAILLGSFFYAFSGGTHSLLMLMYSFIAETSSTGRRTFRMGLLDGFYYLGSPIGLAIAPPLFRSTGYAGVFATCVLIYIFSIIYVVIRLPRGITNDKKEGDDAGEEEKSCGCGVERYSEAFFTTFRPRPNKATKFILILIVAMLFDSFVIWGEANVKYFFTQRALDWDYTQYNHYGTAGGLIKVIGAFLIIPLLTLKTSLKDTMIGLLGASSKALERVFYAFATTPSRAWLMYLGATAGIGSALGPTTIRSLLSKLSHEDIGQVFAVMAVGETLLPFAAAPIYVKLYEATLTSYPGAFFIFSCVLNMMVGACFLYLFFAMNSQQRKTDLPEHEKK